MMMKDREVARRRLSAQAIAMETVAREAMATEAAASVALSHRPDCVCVVCRAADGELEALGEIFDLLLETR